ncbi:MAG: hypothetical protein EOP39_09625 [Rubrivivax sp.]|nr:MAG: hypothetical protein EOP39_09625 [Rubrivivax sp.]
MTVQSLLVRFAVIYLGLLLAIGLAGGAQSNTAANTGALIGAVMFASISFTKRNKRDFSAVEKRNAILGMVAIDAVLQTGVACVLLRSAPSAIGSTSMLLSVLFVTLLHAPVIWFFSGWASKQMALGVAREAAKRQQEFSATH